MDKNLQFLELKRMDPYVISPSKRKKLTRPTIRRSGRNALMRMGEVVIILILSLFAYHKPKDKGTIGFAFILQSFCRCLSHSRA